MLQFYYFYFVLQFSHLPIQDLILASNEFKGISNPLARIGCKYLLLCVQVLFTRLCIILLLVDKPWFSLREILTSTILHLPSSSGKIPTQLTTSRKNFWRRCRGDVIKTYQIPLLKLSYTCSIFYLPLPLVFISPTSKMFS